MAGLLTMKRLFQLACCLTLAGAFALMGATANAPGSITLNNLPGNCTLTLESRFEDGAGVRVHFAAADRSFALKVLNAAVSAYEMLTRLGFNTPGFSFASPDPDYAQDPDRTLDIYLGGNGPSFRDAPCFDALKVSETGYEAMILLPARYKDFIRNWERLNPSFLGRRDIDTDLRGTLAHEMLHAILFYCNKNLEKDSAGASKRLDWYVEGLARYAETFAGARHDFYSQGFKQVLPDRVRFSRGGANYYMRYPDQPFRELRYENALFWRFMDTRFGMAAIGRLSRELRGADTNPAAAFERSTGRKWGRFLGDYARAVLTGDFALGPDAGHLKPVARTMLVIGRKGFELIDGYGLRKKLGRVCSTDWVGSWHDRRARFGGPAAGGDATEQADLAAWATDFIEFTPEDGSRAIGIRHCRGGAGLLVQWAAELESGKRLEGHLGTIPPGQSRRWRMDRLPAVKKAYLLLTTLDPEQPSEYQLTV